MKKIMTLLICLISFFTFSRSVYATNYYDKVNIKATFAENVDMTEIEEIEVHLEDATEFSKDHLLERVNNYEVTLTDVPVGPYKFIYGVVIDDKIGYYSVSATVNINNETNTVDVLVIVETSNIKTNNNTNLTQEEVDRIKGSTTTTKKAESTDESVEIIIDDEEYENDSKDEESKTTVPANIEEAREKEKEEKKKQETRKRNNLIGIIMFSLIGITILCTIIYAGIKIMNANK